MKEELDSFYKRFNIENNNYENEKRFKNALNRILEKYIGNISLKPLFRDEFIKNTGIGDKDFGRVDSSTEIDVGQDTFMNFTGKNYIKFSNTCIEIFTSSILDGRRYCSCRNKRKTKKRN